MNEKKDYKVGFEDIILRRARKDDNMEDIAGLIYDTDPYIYPFWFNDSKEEAIKALVPKIQEPGFIYNYENCYVAFDLTTQRIVALVCAIDPTTDLNYDYSALRNVNDRYRFTIDNYIKILIDEVLEKKYMYLVNVSVNVNYRSNKIGKRMLQYFIEQMHEAGFDEIGFDCLMHNLRAKNLYHSLGFKEVSEGFGFDGTEHSTVEIVFFKKKASSYTQKDFQMMPDSDVKKIDLEREKFIFNALTEKNKLNNFDNE